MLFFLFFRIRFERASLLTAIENIITLLHYNIEIIYITSNIRVIFLRNGTSTDSFG